MGPGDANFGEELEGSSVSRSETERSGGASPKFAASSVGGLASGGAAPDPEGDGQAETSPVHGGVQTLAAQEGPALNARTDTERAMRGLILVAVGAASLAAGGFIALRRAHVERARSGRVTVPTVIAAFVAYLGPSVCSLLASWWSAWLLPLPRGLAYPVLCQNSAHLK